MVGSLLRVCFRHIHFAALCCRTVRGTGGEGEWWGVKSMKRKYAVLVKYSAPESTSAEGKLGERIVVTVCRRDIDVDAMICSPVVDGDVSHVREVFRGVVCSSVVSSLLGVVVISIEDRHNHARFKSCA